MNNNYIICRWRDAIRDPPPDGWRGMILKGCGCVPTHGRYDRVWTTPNGCGTRVFKWLDITAIPAIPREAVQAAVDAVKRSYAPCGCGHGECLVCYLRMDHSEAINYVVSDAVGWISHHTGVTPSEVQ